MAIGLSVFGAPSRLGLVGTARQPISTVCSQDCNHATTKAPTAVGSGPSFSPVRLGGGYEIRTREGLPPTRFPTLFVVVRACALAFSGIQRGF